MGRRRWEGGRLEIKNTDTKEKEKKNNNKRKNMNKIIYILYKIQNHRIINIGKGL